MTFAPRALAVVWAVACAACGSSGNPMVVAHRMGAGNWPQNSRTALRGSIARGYAAIEFDLVLTSDGVPVISHDPWVHPTLCTRADGTALDPASRILIKDVTLNELRTGYVCGGVPDPDHPGAQVVADTFLTLDELIAEVTATPDLWLQFDIKQNPDFTASAEEFVEQIFSRWDAAHLPNPWYASSPEPAVIRAVRARGGSASLTWPNFPPGASTTLVGLGAEVLAQVGIADPLALARHAQASALNMPYQLIDRRVVESAPHEHLDVQVWTLNDERLLRTYCRWPVQAVITDYPERAPCL